MFAQANYPDSSQTGWTDDLIDSIAIYGTETEVVDKLKDVTRWGASEVIASVIPVGPDRKASINRTMHALAIASQR